MKHILYLLLAVALVCGCNGKSKKQAELSAEQIENKLSKGVVLVKNEYYYEIVFGEGSPIYFSGMEDDGSIKGMTLDGNEIEKAVGFGTGFFVSKEGVVATNAHVASPSVDIETVRAALVNAFNALGDECRQKINQLNSDLGELQFAINSQQYSNQEELINQYTQKMEERNNLQERVNNINRLNSANYEVRIHADLGVAFNNTFVTNTSDFQPCVEIKEDAAHDLALIQLKNKTTPENAYVFNVSSRTRTDEKEEKGERRRSKTKGRSRKDVAIGEKLYMIGFNLGPTLALTQEGIKAQVTQGETSQNTDDSKIMYTISSLPGSSGSPIVNRYGRLVAINFAGIGSTQNFNYGIKAVHLDALLTDAGF